MRLTLEEFIALPGDEVRHELNQGELIITPLPSAVHSVIADNIRNIVARYGDDRRIGRVLVGYLLSREPENTVRQPDVSYLKPERVARAVESFYSEGAPELAVEAVFTRRLGGGPAPQDKTVPRGRCQGGLDRVPEYTVGPGVSTRR